MFARKSSSVRLPHGFFSRRQATTVKFELHPRVNNQLRYRRMGELQHALDAEKLQRLMHNKEGVAFYDAKSGHINYIQLVNSMYLRITTPNNRFYIISVGPVSRKNLLKAVENGRFKCIGNQNNLENLLQESPRRLRP